MEFPNVQLYVDGRPQVATKNNPEIIDDWPLHNSHGLNTTMTVGACWQGTSRSNTFSSLSLPSSSFLFSSSNFPSLSFSTFFSICCIRLPEQDATLYARIYRRFVRSDWSDRVARSDRMLSQVQGELGSPSHGAPSAWNGNPQQQRLNTYMI